MLTFTSPFFAVLVSVLVLGETAGRWRWAGVIVGFFGVLLMAGPIGSDISILGALAGLTAAFIMVTVSYQLKDLARTDNPIACVFYLAVFTSIIIGATMPFFAQPHDLFEWGLLLAIGLSGITAQLLLTVSLKYGAVGTVLIMDYTLFLWSTLFGWLVWDMLPQTMTWVGAPLIVMAGLVITWREHRLSREASSLSSSDLD